MNEIRLFTALSQKIFHDLINPASAALNGLELLHSSINNNDREIIDNDILDLLQKSIEKITAQIKFYRFLYADPNNDKEKEIQKSYIEDLIDDYSKFLKLEISLESDHILIRKDHAQVFLNLIIVFIQLFPLGAQVNYQSKDKERFFIRAKPISGKINSEIFEDLKLTKIEEIKNIQVEYTQRLLKEINICYEINLLTNNEVIITQI
ncbi:MAG: histidine phosphotransferase family protein [Hyphomicrobiales bacterium]|nr:histidine phosphotransferase family protein [Hyphomicrobiales bacterium]|tara:strand:- start:669 stop:1289 length:621 start_codon:yes stop_codon:yes gene_type:complete